MSEREREAVRNFRLWAREFVSLDEIHGPYYDTRGGLEFCIDSPHFSALNLIASLISLRFDVKLAVQQLEA